MFDLHNKIVRMQDTIYNFDTLNKIKRQYSKEVVKAIAKKKKWIVKNKSENKMRLRRF